MPGSAVDDRVRAAVAGLIARLGGQVDRDSIVVTASQAWRDVARSCGLDLAAQAGVLAPAGAVGAASGLPEGDRDADAGVAGATGRGSAGRRLHVGPIADALAPAGPLEAASGLPEGDREFGFIAPAAQRRPWVPTLVQRRLGAGVRLDPTIELWQRGWSPVAVDRIEVRVGRDLVELVIGNARPTPSPPS